MKKERWGKMSVFSGLFGRKEKTTSKSFRNKRASELHGLAIKYVTENRDGNDDVIGRGGSIAVHRGDLLVDASGDTVFRCSTDQLDAAYLMSGDGVVLTGPDKISGKDERTVTVHFVYYRK